MKDLPPRFAFEATVVPIPRNRALQFVTFLWLAGGTVLPGGTLIQGQECDHVRIDPAAELSSIASVTLRGKSSDIVITDLWRSGPQTVVLYADGHLKERIYLADPDRDGPLLFVSKIGNDHLEFYRKKVRYSDEDFNFKSWVDIAFTDRGPGKGLRGPLEKASGGRRILALKSWTIALDSLVGYGAVTGDTAATEFGFVKQDIRPFDSEVAFPGAQLIENFTAGVGFYEIGHPYFASIGQMAYYLWMGDRPMLYQYDTRSDRPPLHLWDLPKEDRFLPVLPDSSFQDVFDVIESESMLAGLYSQGGFLYTLYKEVSSRGTAWYVAQLRPQSQRGKVDVRGFIRLPVANSVPHLSILITSSSWVLFPKGKAVYEPPGRPWQEIDKMTVIPRRWITEPTSSPLAVESIGSQEKETIIENICQYRN